MKKHILSSVALAVTATTLNPFPADACSRIVYHGTENLYIVGRSLDWKTPIPTNIYVFPRGVKRQSSDQPGAKKWVSKYGTVCAVGYDGGITEGMNEKGLVINGLFCKGTIYNRPDKPQKSPMSLAVFVAWLLDLNETTDQVVAALKKGDFSIGGATFDGGTVSTLHWGITDASGKTAILEYNNGEMKIYDAGDVWTLTNDPQWPDMLAINAYWNKIGGVNMLPGTVKSSDRFVRGEFFVHHVESVSDADLGVSIAKSVLMNCCVPYFYTPIDEPNVSSTQWTSYANLRDKRYYFQLTTNPGLYYIDMNTLLLTVGSPVLKLETEKVGNLAGCANKQLKKSAPFNPMY